MEDKDEILSLFHHIHHIKNKHEVHHCGGKHGLINPKVSYIMDHCSCGKHRINKKIAVGHAVDEDLRLIEIKVEFFESCPNGGWHAESGIKKRIKETK